MRPIERGPWPVGANNKKKKLHPYTVAKADLHSRLGRYCSYCERVKTRLDVKHVVPKSRQRELEEEWTNLLLACTNCNSIKGKRNRGRDGYLWPDEDDTAQAFSYLPDGIVEVRKDLPEPVPAGAQRLFDLVGLGRRPGNDPHERDLRWRERREAWGIAKAARQSILTGSVDTLLTLAEHTGFWSVWMTVFADNTEFCSLLRARFPGTRHPIGMLRDNATSTQ